MRYNTTSAKTKKEFKARVLGKPLNYVTSDPSIMGPGRIDNLTSEPVVGPGVYQRKWYAAVETDANGIITKVK